MVGGPKILPEPIQIPCRHLQQNRLTLLPMRNCLPHLRQLFCATMVAVFACGAAPGYAETLNCVQFVQRSSSVELHGDAWQWWEAAQGQYGRGRRPQAGAVMVFSKTGILPHGHVAVVRAVRNTRTILIDHANWSPIRGLRGQVEHAVKAIDVSPGNDWSRVRVWFAPVGDIGRDGLHGARFRLFATPPALRILIREGRRTTSGPFRLPGKCRSALRELEAATGFGLPYFLRSTTRGIAGQEAAGLQRGAQTGLEVGQARADAVTHSAGLAGQTAAGDGARRRRTDRSRLAAWNGWLIIMRSTGRAKYTSTARPLTVILPEPGLTQTRATAFLRLPVA